MVLVVARVIVLESRQQAVTWQQCLRPETTHTVLAAGQEHVAHRTSEGRRAHVRTHTHTHTYIYKALGSSEKHVIKVIV